MDKFLQETVKNSSDSTLRIENNRIKAKNQELKYQLDELKTKISLLIPGFDQLTISGPCDICHHKWLSRSNDKDQFDLKVMGRKFYQSDKLDCQCYNICHQCSHLCDLCSRRVCDNHYYSNPAKGLNQCDQCYMLKEKPSNNQIYFVIRIF